MGQRISRNLLLSSGVPDDGDRYVLAIDTETTSADVENHDVQQIGWAVVDKSGRATATGQCLVRPPHGTQWPERSAYHNVRASACVAEGASMAEVLRRVAEVVTRFGIRTVVVYNAEFDFAALMRANGEGGDELARHLDVLRGCTWRCAYRTACIVLPRDGRSFDLAGVHERLFPALNNAKRDWHDALFNALAAGRVYAALVHKVPEHRRACLDIQRCKHPVCGAPTKKGTPCQIPLWKKCRFHDLNDRLRRT